MLDKKHCEGCHDDVYNRELGGPEGCWSRKTGKVVTRFRIGKWTMPDAPRAFTEVRIPNCYHNPRECYVDQVPPHAVDVMRLP